MNKFLAFEHSANSPERKGKDYSELTEEGIRLAKERAEELANVIESSEKGSVIWMGGHSYMDRTKSTLQVFSDSLREHFEGDADVQFLSSEEIGEHAQEGYSKTASWITDRVNDIPEGKVIIDLPLWIKQFSEKDWYIKDGKLKPYQKELLEKYELAKGYGENFSDATKEMINAPDTREAAERVPSPKEIAQSYIDGFDRMNNFSKKFFPNRPIKIVVVGHSLELNSLLTYLANKGEITEEGYKEIGDKTIGFTEYATIELEEGYIKTRYRDKEYTFNIRTKEEMEE